MPTDFNPDTAGGTPAAAPDQSFNPDSAGGVADTGFLGKVASFAGGAAQGFESVMDNNPITKFLEGGEKAVGIGPMATSKYLDDPQKVTGATAQFLSPQYSAPDADVTDWTPADIGHGFGSGTAIGMQTGLETVAGSYGAGLAAKGLGVVLPSVINTARTASGLSAAGIAARALTGAVSGLGFSVGAAVPSLAIPTASQLGINAGIGAVGDIIAPGISALAGKFSKGVYDKSLPMTPSSKVDFTDSVGQSPADYMLSNKIDPRSTPEQFNAMRVSAKNNINTLAQDFGGANLDDQDTGNAIDYVKKMFSKYITTNDVGASNLANSAAATAYSTAISHGASVSEATGASFDAFHDVINSNVSSLPANLQAQHQALQEISDAFNSGGISITQAQDLKEMLGQFYKESEAVPAISKVANGHYFDVKTKIEQSIAEGLQADPEAGQAAAQAMGFSDPMTAVKELNQKIQATHFLEDAAKARAVAPTASFLRQISPYAGGSLIGLGAGYATGHGLDPKYAIGGALITTLLANPTLAEATYKMFSGGDRKILSDFINGNGDAAAASKVLNKTTTMFNDNGIVPVKNPDSKLVGTQNNIANNNSQLSGIMKQSQFAGKINSSPIIDKVNNDIATVQSQMPIGFMDTPQGKQMSQISIMLSNAKDISPEEYLKVANNIGAMKPVPGNEKFITNTYNSVMDGIDFSTNMASSGVTKGLRADMATQQAMSGGQSVSFEASELQRIQTTIKSLQVQRDAATSKLVQRQLDKQIQEEQSLLAGSAGSTPPPPPKVTQSTPTGATEVQPPPFNPGATPAELHQAGQDQKPAFDQTLQQIGQDTGSAPKTTDVKTEQSIKDKQATQDLGGSEAGTATSADASLIEEAKKYKSAEEFVKDNAKYYHGTTAENKILQEGFKPTPSKRGTAFGGNRDVQSPVFFFTENYDTAKMFANNRAENLGGVASVMPVSINAKNTLNLTGNIKTKNIVGIFDKADVDLYKYFGVKNNDLINPNIPSNLDVSPNQLWQLLDDPKVVSALKDQGFDSVLLQEQKGLKKSLAVFDPKNIKTESQLKDIWKQAHSK